MLLLWIYGVVLETSVYILVQYNLVIDYLEGIIVAAIKWDKAF